MDVCEWLTRLISFDTTSSHSNLPLIHAIQNYLNDYKIQSTLTYDASGKKANLFATLPGCENSLDGGLILSGHTDTVPVANQQWNSNPFQASIVDDKIYGRGTCDMKGFLAVVLSLVPELTKEKLRKPLHFAFSYDEEVGCLGAPQLIENFQQLNIQPAACIVGEPTSMRPIVAHKGINGFRCKVHGHAAHSSLTPNGCNAIEYAAEIIHWIRCIAEKARTEGPYDSCYDVSYSTLSTNLIQGGTALNIIPNLCEFIFELRNLPMLQPQQVLSEMKEYIAKKILPKLQKEYIETQVVIDALYAVPAFETSEENTFTKLIRELTGEKEIFKVAYATEAGLFQQANISTIVCGPGSIEQAHTANEFVTLGQLEQCRRFIPQLIKLFLF
jgi:acetylornithine deacetylase